jgi:hypothetical protein
LNLRFKKVFLFSAIDPLSWLYYTRLEPIKKPPVSVPEISCAD